MKITLIYDDPIYRAKLKALLEEEGHRVHVKRDAADLRTLYTDKIITDNQAALIVCRADELDHINDSHRHALVALQLLRLRNSPDPRNTSAQPPLPE